MARSIFYDSLKRILFAFFATMFVAPAFSATLPAGYTQLEYLESDGSQYIDTGLALQTATDDIELIYQANEITSGNSLFGARNSTTGRVYTFAISSTLKYRVGWNSSSPTLELDADTNKHTLKIEHNGGVFKLDGTTIATQGNAEIITPTTATLFAIHATTSTGIYNGYGKIYEYKMWRNGTLTQHMIPVKYVSGNTTTYGMYDLMDSNSATAFHTNAGTGTFVAGPTACPGGTLETRHESGLPVGYQKLDKITFGGGYIVTDIYPNLDTEFILDVQKGVDSLTWLFGTRSYENGSTIAYNKYGLQAFSSSTNTLWLQIDNTSLLEYNSVAVTSSQEDRLARHTIGIKNRKIYFDGQEVAWGAKGTPDATVFTATSPLILGSIQTASGVSTAVFTGVMHSATGLIFCKRESDNAVGVYNPATGVFSAGTGTLTAGNIVSDPIVEQCVGGGAIKIATTKYNEDAFADLITTLNSAITKVTNIVDTTVAQASSIGTLATTKQDRPADGDCPAGRKCLLVTGTDGKPHWYLIQE